MLPKKRKPGCKAVLSNAAVTDLIFWWSGATPKRTRPNGVGSRSNMSTWTTSRSWRKSWSAA
jgi:hypothetical protein